MARQPPSGLSLSWGPLGRNLGLHPKVEHEYIDTKFSVPVAFVEARNLHTLGFSTQESPGVGGWGGEVWGGRWGW